MNVSTYVCREDNEGGFVVGDVVGCGAGLVFTPNPNICLSMVAHVLHEMLYRVSLNCM